MAVGMANSGGEAGHYNGRLTVLIVLSCLMAIIGGIIYGYDLGISGGVTSMESFLKQFFPQVLRKMKEDTNVSNYCKFDSQLLSLFTSSLYLAAMVSPFFASYVTKTFGRKPSILVAGVSFLAGAALGGSAVNVYMLIVGRVMLGFGLGFATQAVPLYISEMALPRHRGAMNIGFDWGAGMGILIAYLTNYGTVKIAGGWGWRVSLSMVAVPASFLILGAIFLPETPNNLIHNSNNPEKAKRTLQRLRGTPDVQAELDDLISATSTTSTTHNVSFSAILKKKYRPQLLLGVAMPVFQQLTGINVVTFYAPVLFRTMGLGQNSSLMTAVVIGAVTIFSTFVSMLVVDRFGRRTLLIVGGVQMFVAQMVIGAVMAAKFGDHGGLDKGYAYLVLVMVCVFVGGFAWSWGPMRWLIPTEIFSSEIRSAGQSVTVTVGFFCTFATSQTILAMLCHFKSGIFFFFGGWLVVMTVFVYFLLPETKNVPMEQMERVWREHWFWKRIAGEVDSDIKGSN